ncbi:MAG: methionine synthase [Treponema sp.]|jgi:5-methyltetrahydrofolate--homocysteine methyltransferase|nr:methionine synthase [Treponema sp.]
MTSRDELDHLARKRILILDGAMGSMILARNLSEGDYRGKEFAAHGTPLLGCNDALCLTMPELIGSIHEAYLEAGADIVTSCSFNANAVSLVDYGLAGRAYDISRAAGELARKAAKGYSTPEKPRFAAGSLGPTSKSGSISPDMDDPGRRSVTWDELEAAYYDNARGLLDGGVDLLLLETCFDTLNAKAAIAAILRLREERGADIPLMISATISGASGRLLAGQTVEAFAVSAAHGDPFSLGLNCSLGAEKILPHLKALAAFTPFLVSCHPNAGLPDRFGRYLEGPEETVFHARKFLDQGLVNILGGCCGTTPAHIAAIAETAKRYAPRSLPAVPGPRGSTGKSFLAGLEPLDLDEGFINIGERTNVAGSAKFLRLIQRGGWEEAADLARDTIAAGARIIDVCMDDALLESKESMVRFLNLALSDPEIARVPVMPDSSRWETLEAALKCLQGKGLVNSISLKEGEGEFLRRAALIRRYGAAAVVMLFDEEGQALTYERKVETARRSYRLLTEAGFPAEDIVFDPNVLTIATGMAEHDRYALDFISACAWIREHCPGAHISGGISNLSFSFRGSGEIRAALHAAFLKHAAAAGLSMAILNPAGLRSPEEIPGGLWKAAEDAILCRDEPDGETGGSRADRLLAAALKEANSGGGTGEKPGEAADQWRLLPLEERVVHSLVKGIDRYIAEDVLALYHQEGRSCLEIIEGPLTRGMEEVGRRFGEGKMFLPQVIRGARVIKKAAAALEPLMDPASGKGVPAAGGGKIALATVKGDVHDIGKNILAVILGCNGYEVIDLGVMVPAEKILAAVKETNAAGVGLSGLISPSLDEMVRVAEEMERSGLTIPLLIGGAAASAAHTALRIAPAYSGPVVYLRDAGQTPPALGALLSPRRRAAFLEKLEAEYAEARRTHGQITERRIFLSLEEARANRPAIDWEAAALPQPKHPGLIPYDSYPAEKVIARIDWDSFCRSWDMNPKTGSTGNAEERRRLIADAEEALKQRAGSLSLRAMVGFFPALSENEDIVLYQRPPEEAATPPDPGANGPGPERARFCFPRNQEKKPAGAPNLCLADFVLPRDRYDQWVKKGWKDRNERPLQDWLGLFALTAEFTGPENAAAGPAESGGYGALLAATLTNCLAEAFAEELHEKVRSELWPSGDGGDTGGANRGIRPAFGYPACPDHRDKETAFALLEARERIGLALSESAMIIPPSSLCGMYFAHPEARYFSAGEIAPDQLERWARRKGLSPEEARRRMGRV